jgi:hypothetical protein
MTDLTMPLSCDEFADRLADYLEGDLPEAARVAMEAHADVCADCGPLLVDIGALRGEAAALPALMPSRDLWAGIAERIDARVLPLDSPRVARTIPARRTWMRPAVAAAALVIAAAGVSHVLTRMTYDPTMSVASASKRVAALPADTQSTPTSAAVDGEFTSTSTEQPSEASSLRAARPTVQPSNRRTVQPSNRPTVRPSNRPTVQPSSRARLASAVPLMEAAEPIYDREIVKLRKIVRERREQLDPRTIAVLEQSIAVIDSAIAQSRAALAKDPASGFLATQLNHSLEKKVELLRTAALLPART